MAKVQAVVKTSYTRNPRAAKASIRYYAHRIDREGNRTTRAIFGANNLMTKDQAYRMIDQAKPERAYFYRIILSPERSLGETADLQKVTRQTMRQLQKILGSTRPIPFAAVAHTDHSDTQHVHALAVLRTYLNEEKLTKLREACEGVVVTGQAQSAQTLRPVRHQLSASGARTQPTDRPFTPSLRWQARPMPLRQDIFIAKSITTTRARGSEGMNLANYPGRKLFICPGCNQPSKLKKKDNYFECKKCGMEIGRKKRLYIFAQRREGGQSYT